ncbi:GDSL-type esterase/lipase family protein [Leifsonia sp. 2MCAF36]|uniref:GDSL-type esterase/lipase family protein n=1 Tax=Leifsonia sp. 2MCAF36 TaxID=3232988 RepID=UPI003F9B2CDC
MSTLKRPDRSTALATLGGAAALAATLAMGAAIRYVLWARDDPSRYEHDVRELQRRFAADPERDGILLSGSSFFERWTTSGDDLAPLITANIGIGGTRAGDHIAYLDRMVLPRRPRVLVLYIGSNDISGAPFFTKSADRTVDLIMEYIQRVQRALPETRIYYVAITEAPQRARVRSEIQKANRRLAAESQSGGFRFIDTSQALLRADGSMNRDLFGPDRLHFNERGYRVFASAVRQGLEPEYSQLADEA